MPHVIVKIATGRSQQEKALLARALSEAVTTTLGIGEEAISVAIEDVEPHDWARRVYEPDILTAGDRLYKKPGYTL